MAFGFSTAFFSSFGQTYFVSLFLLSLVEALGISQGQFGTLYAGATLAAGLTLPTFGRWLDARTERTALLVAGAGLLISMGLFASSTGPWTLAPALFGLRAFGQGAMSLMSATAMARYFSRRRGLALGVASLGFPCGEMLLPAATLLGISILGWRSTTLFFLGLLAVGITLIAWLLMSQPLRHEQNSETTKAEKAVSRRLPRIRFPWWKNPLFLLVSATSAVLPFGGTIMMLYLVPITRAKDWPTDFLATGFVAFAVTRALTSLLVAPLIDRFGGVQLYAWSMAPFSMAVGILYFATSPWVGLGFFVMLGLGFGASTTLTALFAETYGNRQLGEIRALCSSVAVLSSALGPFVAGWAITRGYSFDQILGWLGAVAVLALAAAFTTPIFARAVETSSRP